MPKKRHKPEEIVAKLRQVDVLVSQGQSVADAIRSIGVTEESYHRLRSMSVTTRSKRIALKWGSARSFEQGRAEIQPWVHVGGEPAGRRRSWAALAAQPAA